MTPREVLERTPFFAGVMSGADLDRLAAKLLVKSFPRGACIVRQGDIGTSMFILVDGKVNVTLHLRAGEERVATLGPGNIVGEMSLLTGARRSATVTATRAVNALEIGKAAMEEILADGPELIGRFAEMVEQRKGEIDNLQALDDRQDSIGLSRAEIAARMTAFYAS